MRRKAQTEGCTAALPHRYPAKPGRALPCVSWGTMLASSRKPCDAANPKRRAKSPALHCGRGLAATHKRQAFARPTGGPMQASAPTQRDGIRRACGGLPFPVPPPVCLAL